MKRVEKVPDIVRAAESFTFEAIGQDWTLTIFFDPID